LNARVAGPALGRGLSALIPSRDDASAGPREIPLSEIRVNPNQPRRDVEHANLEALATSISTSSASGLLKRNISAATGVAAMLFWHVFINVGMVSGLLPVVGVTLPLVSYGGSSILTTAAALGLVMNVSVRRFSY